ncbi:MAG: carboxypeptidase regulatory-like domain-containing protein [Chitinophagaceae bacterium]|nr:MAG: carboxypeptidase regulatory-like domain-containing protein [Chitinophagaceae bacterium]
MRFLSRLTLILLTALLLGSCQKIEQYDSTPITGPTDPVDPVVPILPDPVRATLMGNVVDENGAPAAGVTVKAGSSTATTDSRGFFRITGAALDKKQSLVTATKAGYFRSYRSFAATSGANEVVIKLTKRSLTGTVDAAAGGSATLANGSKVTLPAGAVADAATGAPYTGSVSVYAAYIDPSAPDIGATVPGSLMADDKDGRRVQLNSFGMMAVELEGSSGQKLQIRSGSAATLTFAIPAAAQASAPATIPLWYVDETTGIWKEQGTATKTGNQYTGTVSHFSFWNCDTPLGAVYVSFTLKSPSGQPLAGATVRLTRPAGTGWNTATYGWTDSLGQVSGLVPRNETLVLDVMSPCGTPVFSQNTGPFSSTSTVPPITVNLPAPNITTVTGTLQNCSGAAVTNGFALIVANNLAHYASVDANGQFSMQLVGCSAPTGNITVLGIDNASQVQSAPTIVANASGTVNAGTISACTVSSTQFITYTIDNGTPVTMTTPQDSLVFEMDPGGSATGAPDFLVLLNARTASGANSFYMAFIGGPAPGSSSLIGFSLTGHVPTNDRVNANVTTWPAAVGDFMVGTLSGDFYSGGTQHTISGSFRLRRNQ